jgi:hypothetical protein
VLAARLSGAVRAIRLRYAVLVVLLLVAAYVAVIHPWMANWGSTAAERRMALAGDELFPAEGTRSTMAITIGATPEVVWQWLVQVGQDRGGFYSYTWLENLLGVDIHNADRIHPEWQHLATGDTWRLAPADYLRGLAKDAVVPVVLSDPGRALVVGGLGGHGNVALDAQASRLIVRGEPQGQSFLTVMLLDPVVFTMERRMLLGLKARAEGRPSTPLVLTAAARVGWVAAAVAVAALFLVRRRRRFWLVVPVFAALPAVLMAGDIEAALAAFLAVGISVLGFLAFGRTWLGSYLVVASVVLLTLLLAPDAYVAIGIGFLLVAAVGAVAAVRGRTRPTALERPSGAHV